MYMLDWEQALAAGALAAGGKGWNLARLHRYGFTVPTGGVAAAAAYRVFTQHPDLAPHIARFADLSLTEVGSATVATGLAELQARIIGAALPTIFVGELEAFLRDNELIDRPVAVRSSASAEDSPTASFAGIHQSFLNVCGLPAVVEALKRCWASLWTPQALAYRRRFGLADADVAAAVVILAMVDAKTAGVGFSCDPRTGRLDRFAISASLGLGESVVSGNVEPDEYLVNCTVYPPTSMSERIGRKQMITVAVPQGGTQQSQVTAAAASQPALSRAQIIELALLIGRIHDALGQMAQPQDVEWAYDGEQFWVLQARPVTTLPPATFPAVADQTVVWSNANLRDVMPGVQSTLGWSFLRGGIDTLLSAPLTASGYGYAGGVHWIRLFEGRAYFNLTAMQWAFYDALAIIPGEVNQVLGGHQPEIAVPPHPGLRDRVRRYLARTRLIRATLRVMKGAPHQFARVTHWCEQMEAVDLAEWSNGRLMDHMLEIKTVVEDFLPHFQMINSGAGGTHQELIKLLAPLFGERAPGLVNAMLAGATRVTSAEQGERLVSLGNAAMREPLTRAYFEEPQWEPLSWQERLAGTQFLADFGEYLRQFGHRGVYELEPMNPRWREDPTYLLQTVRSQVLSGRSILVGGQADKRRSAERDVRAKLGLRPRALRVRFMLRQAALSSSQREMAKSMLVRVIGVSRLTALEIGRRLTAAGLLGCPEDVFHLSWLDLEAYLMDRPGVHALGALVVDRKARRAEQLRLEAPDLIIGEHGVKKAPPPQAAGNVLTGLGVAAGQAKGIARVIDHPHEGHRLQPGEILVAPSTDPAWTPLFLRAAAVVTEVGGYLSHGAIVAREYGLPAVVNVPGLLQVVHDGQEMVVDGDTGKVYLSK